MKSSELYVVMNIIEPNMESQFNISQIVFWSNRCSSMIDDQLTRAAWFDLWRLVITYMWFEECIIDYTFNKANSDSPSATLVRRGNF